jgi:hypothetical protein
MRLEHPADLPKLSHFSLVLNPIGPRQNQPRSNALIQIWVIWKFTNQHRLNQTQAVPSLSCTVSVFQSWASLVDGPVQAEQFHSVHGVVKYPSPARGLHCSLSASSSIKSVWQFF